MKKVLVPMLGTELAVACGKIARNHRLEQSPCRPKHATGIAALMR